jgi:anti-sigma28 factor (negative regulator of flagellin synthesis)
MNIIKNYTAGGVTSVAPLKAEQKIDEVSVSRDALSFSAVFSKLKEQLEIRTPEEKAHIEEVARQVKGGGYKIESAKVADSIIDNYV